MRGNKEKTPPARGELNAFLGEGTDFKGILTFEGTVHIDGKLEGEVYTKDTLVIGENAVVAAEINVHTIIVRGVVRGNITATSKVELYRPGKVFGNVKTPSLSIEEGVIFEGSCSMGQDVTKVTSIRKEPETVEEAQLDENFAATIKSD
jgi:cytoskeletal protein CcmA (bactofilin family)